ncbi:MAG: EAL domain-containing protein [Coriobacteriales bacterium]|nr:EAL domain-containing protein [Coriobacteriales bacterium]
MLHPPEVLPFELDELTDLPKISYFHRYAGKYVEAAHRRGRKAYLLYFNLENFSVFNERYGFKDGNKLLNLMAVTIGAAFPGYLLSRVSEDHFLLMCESLNLEGQIKEAHDQLRSYGRHVDIELKTGIYEMPAGDVDIALACDRARVACDSVSHRYDKIFCWFNDALLWELERKHYIENNIDRAIAKGWIKAYFQPIVRTVTGEVCEFEALARWDDANYGMLSPAVFIDVLEQAHLIHKLDRCMVRLACEEWQHMAQTSTIRVPVSVNLSRLDFELCDAFAMVDEIAQEYGVPRQMLHVEITESALNDNSELLGREVARFRSAGYQVWMDDFGSGYSSLNTLQDYVFDVVKIDMAFLRNFDEKPKSRVIIASVVNMAKQLGMQTLIEGVETPEQFDFVRGIGCEFVQGYLIGRPAPTEHNTKRIEAGELVMEESSLHGYYDRLGGINSLSATPFEFPWESAAEERPLAEMLPLAIVERESIEVRFLTANDAFVGVLRELGLGTMAEVARELTRGERSQSRVVLGTLDKSASTGSIESVDLLENGRHCVLRVRHIASHEGVDAFLVSLMNLSRFSSVSEERLLQIALHYLYAVYDEVRIVDLADGSTNTIYRSNTSFSQAVANSAARESVEEFARSYVHPADRERYLAYMDFSTLDERLRVVGRSNLADAFRALNVHGMYSWVTVVLLSILIDGERAVLICTRTTNEAVTSTMEGEGVISNALLWNTLLELVPAGVFWKDKNRRFLGVNKNFLDFYEFESVNEVLGKTDEDMQWHVDTEPFMNDELAVINKGESIVDAHGTCISRGEVRNIRANKIPLRRNGEVVGLLGYFMDETDQIMGGGSTGFMRSGFDRLAETDQLTGILNLRGLLLSSVSYEKAFDAGGPDFCYTVIDIRGMSDFNEVYGRSFGNRILKVLAHRLSRARGVSGVVGRVGGDKFASLFQVTSMEEAQQEIMRLRGIVEDVREIDGLNVQLNCAQGWALYSEKKDASEVISLAESRMRYARATGTGRPEGPVL